MPIEKIDKIPNVSKVVFSLWGGILWSSLITVMALLLVLRFWTNVPENAWTGFLVIWLIGFAWTIFGVRLSMRSARRLLHRQVELCEIVESSPHPIMVVDVESRQIKEGNLAAGMDGSSLEGITCHHCHHGQDTPCEPSVFPCPLEEVVRTGRPARVEHMHRISSDNVQVHEVYGVPIFGSDGGVTHMIEHCFDITNLRQAESITRNLQWRYERVQELGSTGILEVEIPTGKISLSNESYRIFGIDPGSDIMLKDFRCSVFQDDRESVEQGWEAALGGEPYDIEYRIKTEGGLRWIRESANLARDENGKAVRANGFVRDITDCKLKELELKGLKQQFEERVQERTDELEKQIAEVDKLNSAMVNLAEDLKIANRKQETTTSQLANANAELEAFAYSVSHDLRAPLRAVIGFSEMFFEDYSKGLDSSGKHQLTVIQDSARNMGKLIEDLLAFSHLGRKSLEHCSIDMNNLVQGLVENQQHLETEREPQWTIHKLSPALGDRSMVRQVLTNLISNAIKYTEAGKNPDIEISSITTEEGVEYTVQDQGIGFDMKYVGKIFGVFQRLHSSDEYEGTGIGLALVQRIVKRHGGRIWAEGAVGKGASFHFTLAQAKEKINVG